MFLFFTIIMIVLSILVAMFAILNAITVPLNFILWEFNSSLVLVILGAFFAGVLVTTCFLLIAKAQHYLADKKMREEITALQNEKQRLEERISMLQHTQILHQEAEVKNKTAATKPEEAQKL